MLELSEQIIYKKIEQCLIDIPIDIWWWEACEISKCKNAE